MLKDLIVKAKEVLELKKEFQVKWAEMSLKRAKGEDVTQEDREIRMAHNIFRKEYGFNLDEFDGR